MLLIRTLLLKRTLMLRRTLLLMWTLLTGARPAPDEWRPESISNLRKDIPREIAAAIDAALELVGRSNIVWGSDYPHIDSLRVDDHLPRQWPELSSNAEQLFRI